MHFSDSALSANTTVNPKLCNVSALHNFPLNCWHFTYPLGALLVLGARLRRRTGMYIPLAENLLVPALCMARQNSYICGKRIPPVGLAFC